MATIQLESDSINGTSIEIELAKVIYQASFQPSTKEQANRQVPSPGWSWEKTSEEMRAYCLHEARCVIDWMKTNDQKVMAILQGK